jgi:hypothetical protein
LAVEIEPLLDASEGGELGEIVEDEGTMGLSEVAGDEAFETFLAGCVPELYSVGFLVVLDVGDDKIDAYC